MISVGISLSWRGQLSAAWVTQVGLRKKVVAGVGWSALQSWGRQAISFIVLLVLARLLKPEDFGLVAMASVFVAFTQVFVDQGFGAAVVQRVDLEREHLDTAFWISMLSGVLLAGAGVILSGVLARIYGEPKLTPVVRWLSLSLLLTALGSTQVAILKRELAFKELAIRSLLAALLGGLSGVVMAFLGFGVWSLVAQRLVGSLVDVAVLWRASNWRPRFCISKSHFRDLFSFGIHILGTNILDFFNRRSDDFLIGYFLGSTALGYYSIAYQVLLVTTGLLTGIISNVAFPAFSRLQGNIPRMRDAFYRVTRYTSLMTFPAFVGISVMAPEIVEVLYGPQWAPAVTTMRILMLIGVLHSVFYFNNNVILANGKSSWRFRINVLNAVANVIGFLIAVRWGIAAVATAYVLRGYLLAPIPIWAVRQLIDIDIDTYLRQYLLPIAGSLAMFLVVVCLKSLLDARLGLNLRLVICVFGGAVIYTSVVCILAPSLSTRLLSFARNMLGSKRVRF